MELEINAKELEKLLLEWAEQHWPGAFNSVDLGGKYSSRGATFRKTEEEDKPDPQA